MSKSKYGKLGRDRGTHRNKTGNPNRSSDNSTELKIRSATDAHQSANEVLRKASRFESNIKEYPLVIAALRSEDIASPTEPQRPVLTGPQREVELAKLEYTAKYQVYTDRLEEVRKQSISLYYYVHHVLLSKSFQKELEQAYPNHASMELRDYIEAVKSFYNITISSLPTQRKQHAKNQWSGLNQSEMESLAEFMQTVNDAKEEYNSAMTLDRHLTDSEIAEAFITGLNSNFDHFKANMEREQMEKLRIRESSQDPTPYLDHFGYPSNLSEAYRKAREYEESQRDVKGTKSTLSSFTTQANDRADKLFEHKKTGKKKSIKEMTINDKPRDYDLPPCNKCYPRYPGNHFAKCHDEFMDSIRNKNKRPSKSDPKFGKKKLDFKQKAKEEVKQALVTLKKAAKAKEKAAKRDKAKAENNSEQASQFTTLLSTFDSDTD